MSYEINKSLVELNKLIDKILTIFDDSVVEDEFFSEILFLGN